MQGALVKIKKEPVIFFSRSYLMFAEKLTKVSALAIFNRLTQVVVKYH